MKSCRQCTHSSPTWVRSLKKTVYACRLGENTEIAQRVQCIKFELDTGSDIYEGSIQDTFN